MGNIYKSLATKSSLHLHQSAISDNEVNDVVSEKWTPVSLNPKCARRGRLNIINDRMTVSLDIAKLND